MTGTKLSYKPATTAPAAPAQALIRQMQAAAQEAADRATRRRDAVARFNPADIGLKIMPRPGLPATRTIEPPRPSLPERCLAWTRKLIVRDRRLNAAAAASVAQIALIRSRR